MADSEKLIKAEKLFNEGYYDKALEAVKKYEKRIRLTGDDLIKCLLLKSSVLMMLGKFDESLKSVQNVLIKSRDLGNSLWILDALIIKAKILEYQGEADEVVEVKVYCE